MNMWALHVPGPPMVWSGIVVLVGLLGLVRTGRLHSSSTITNQY